MLDIALFNERQHRQFEHRGGPCVLARAAAGGSLWMAIDQARADQADALVEIFPAADGIDLVMAGCEAECYCGRRCELTGSCHLDVPARFSIGDTQFEIFNVDRRFAKSRPLERLLADRTNIVDTDSPRGGPSPETLTRWFRALGTLNRWATSVQELYVQAARCAVESIGLDGAIVLRRRDDAWEIAASHLPDPQLGIRCDRRVLDQLLTSPETLFHGRAGGEERGERGDVRGGRGERGEFLDLPSPISPFPFAAPAVVVSPLRNGAGELAGAIYGYRSVRAGNARRGIRYLEAHMIESLANAVSDSIARLEHEAEVDRRRVLLEQAFVATLEHNPQRIIGEQREVTLLFADLRDFSRLSASLATEEVCELLSQVMDALTAAVMDHDGLVIDYYGDGLAAMWNAPADQSDHPELACRAALRMLETLPDIAADWADVLATELRLGIGIHTGSAQVGNAGSRRRLKYGPRGANVHLASRVEAATKELGQPLVVTAATASRLSNRFLAYRLCRVELPGIERAVDLFGLLPAASSATAVAAIGIYGEALQLFEQGQLQRASALLRQIDRRETRVPIQFLAEQIERDQNREHSRRHSDKRRETAPGIIPLNVK
jgi:adenylate cyclase